MHIQWELDLTATAYLKHSARGNCTNIDDRLSWRTGAKA